jgi:putative transposase
VAVILRCQAGGLGTSPPGYWGNREDGRELRTYLRNDTYTVQWGEYSRIELLVGPKLKQDYGLAPLERPRFEIRGNPSWRQYEKQGRLELHYKDDVDRFRAHQPVVIDDARLASPRGDEVAALDIGANILVACTVTTGARYLYDGDGLFERYHETTEEIARLESLLPDGQRTSRRIRRLQQRQARRRNHAQDTLCRDLIDRLHDQGVLTIYVGDLTNILTAHRSNRVNEKTHRFWAFRRLIERLRCTAEEYGMGVEERSEAWTSQTCPACGSAEQTIRYKDTLSCACGFEGHVDLTASETFLRRQTNTVWPMARPVRLTWDNHQWRTDHSSPPARDNDQRGAHKPEYP